MPVKIERDTEFDDKLAKHLMKRFEGNTRINDLPHVSDIIPTSCLRQAFYRRMYPEMNPLTNESVHHFIRGESSEHIIVELANMGVTQEKTIFKNVIARPDILSKDERVIVELKNTVAGERMDSDDDVYRGYLRQLLYYLTMTGYTDGKLSIRYDQKELVWKFRDKKGNDWYMRPKDPKPVGTETWKVTLDSDDPVRHGLEQEIEFRGNLFTQALQDGTPLNLPRVPEKKYNFKCKGCPYKDRCYNEDGESEEARNIRQSIDLLDIPGNLEVK